MGIFLLILLAIAVVILLARLLSQLNDLQSAFAYFTQDVSAKIRRLEDQVSAQAEETARLAKKLAQDPSIASPVPIPTPAAAPQTYAVQSTPPVAETIQAQGPQPPPAPARIVPTVPVVQAAQPIQPPTAQPPMEQPAVEPPINQPINPIPTYVSQYPPQPAPPDEPSQSISLEERLGANWLNKLGIVILVIGMAFFLAVRLKTMGPGGKVLTGLTISLGLLGGGIWLERKQPYRVFARAGIGGGWALLFFTIYAMHHLDATRILSSLVLDLLLMLLVATGMVLHSLRYRSQTVTGLAFLLGYATVATSHFESAQGTVVFSLSASAVLALGLVVVTTRRHWAWLELAGLIGVLANHFLWLSLVLPATRTSAGFPLFLPSAILILFYWLIFRAAYLLRQPLDQNEDRISSLTAVLTGAGILGLLKYQSTHPEWAFRTLLVLGTLELLLGIWSRHRRRSAFVVLTTVGAVLLVAAVPFQFHGVSWPILWLVEAHVLALCGIRLGEPIFRRLGLLAGFGASLVLAIHDVLPLALSRLQEPDPGRHPSLTVGLALAAALFWLHAELYPRRWPEVAAQLGELESLALQITSWLGLAAAAAALWVVLPAQWIVVGWLALVIFLGLVADWKSIIPLALQADALAASSLIGFCVWNHNSTPTGTAKLTTAIAIALFYLGTRRRTALENSPNYIAPTYSWIASIGVLYWIVQFIPDEWRIVAFAAVAITLFEIGRFFQKGYLRWQGHAAAILAVLALQVVWVELLTKLTTVHGWFALSGPELVSLLGTAALGYWVQEKTTSFHSIERKFGFLLGACATLAIALWLPILVPSWGNTAAEPIAWATLATALLLVAFAARRRVFQLHGIAVSLFAAAYVAYLAVIHGIATPETLPWWQSNLFRISLSSAILLVALPVAFRLRKPLSENETPLPPLFKHPEQWFFFVPFGMMIATLAAELRSGNITLGWSLLGLGAFVFALIVGERSFRLGGLSLLLLSVAKILLMDVWTLSPADRYTTLIVMGCALLLVSFLYTRFRETFRKYL